jgi:acyl CoA:acetate/3-ketoacid CoA transferase beta subunit
LGVLDVNEQGDLAYWMFPGRGVGNIGGGMTWLSALKGS